MSEIYTFNMYIVNLYNVKWKRKYTQDEIAEQTGLSKRTINQLFSGKHYNYELFTLETIARFFNCDLHEILIKVEESEEK